jgi:hypothetical protein
MDGEIGINVYEVSLHILWGSRTNVSCFRYLQHCLQTSELYGI